MTLRTYPIHKSFLFLIFLVPYLKLSAQVYNEPSYPKGYFAYPLDIPISLVANFGELRPNHYHMGLDCRTEHKQNLPVHAAADGYIAKVKIEPGGFGRAIFINHPNGLTTVYGHLNAFWPELEKYVKAQQYKEESWKVYINIPPSLFPVRKGEFIAFSGSTGASEGPHVHFEVRDTKTDKALNPLLFGFPIKDDVPPSIIRLALYDRRASTYEQGPALFPVRKINGSYIVSPEPIIVHTDKVSFGISANDKLSGSVNPNGIYEACIYDDDKPLDAFRIDSITYEETRYLNAHIDYKKRAEGGPFIEHLSRLPGYPQGIYRDINGDGVIRLNNSEIHKIKIVVKDAYQNTSVLQFDIKRADTIQSKPLLGGALFRPQAINIFDDEDIRFYTSERSLYDSFHLVHTKSNSSTPDAVSYLHQVASASIPVHDSITFHIRAAVAIPADKRDKIIMQCRAGEKVFAEKAARTGEWYSASFRSLGAFQLLMDDQPPVISSNIIQNAKVYSSQIVINVKDNNRDVKNFRAELDGKWLRFTNDKGKLFIYTFDEMCGPGTHQLKISVEDIAGNKTMKTYDFTR